MNNTLDELIYKEEILEICFWYQGEGFGNEFTAQALSPFLNQPTEKVESVLQELCGTGRMEQTARGSYQFLEAGTQEVDNYSLNPSTKCSNPDTTNV